MGLTNGTRLGPYEILGPLGAGGMGEIGQARDTPPAARNPHREPGPEQAHPRCRLTQEITSYRLYLEDPVELDAILTMSEGTSKTAALAAWVQGLYSGDQPPILVGGAAVELYTRGAYVTGDLDFVGRVPSAVDKALKSAGFKKQGRHYLHETGQVFLEFPGRSLSPGELPARVKVGRCTVWVVSPEDALVDRLAAWTFWESAVDGVNAFLLFEAQKALLDRRRLMKRARETQVLPALASLKRLSVRHRSGKVNLVGVKRWAEKGP